MCAQHLPANTSCRWIVWIPNVIRKWITICWYFIGYFSCARLTFRESVMRKRRIKNVCPQSWSFVPESFKFINHSVRLSIVNYLGKMMNYGQIEFCDTDLMNKWWEKVRLSALIYWSDSIEISSDNKFSRREPLA